MAHLEGESSNALFDDLKACEQQLRAEYKSVASVLQSQEPMPDRSRSRTRAPQMPGAVTMKQVDVLTSDFEEAAAPDQPKRKNAAISRGHCACRQKSASCWKNGRNARL